MIRKLAAVFTLTLVSGFAYSQDTLYSLEDCINIALEKNLSVRLSELDYKNSEIDLFQSKMDRLPNLNLSGGYGINWGRSIDPTSNDFINQRIKFSSFSGNSSVTLFNGLQLTNSIRRDQLNLEASEYDLYDTQNDVALNVASFYLDVLFNKELLQNAQNLVEVTSQQLERTTILVEAGVLPITRQLEIESQLATNEVELVRAENSLNLSILNLKQALQIPASDPFDVVIPQFDFDATAEIIEDPQLIYENAMASQPDIKSADLKVESSILDMKVARGAVSPQLTLDGSLRTNFSDFANQERIVFDGISEQDIPIGFLQNDPNQVVLGPRNVPNNPRIDPDFTFSEQFNENLSKSISLNLQIPVFNRWRVRNNVQRAQLGNEQAEIQAAQVRNQLRQSIETAHNNTNAALKSFQASTRQVAALERTFENVSIQLGEGIVNQVDYEIASNNLFKARSDLTRAKYEYIFRLKILDFYQGKPLSFD
ncbi:MAG: TolC family protein [Cyclobacteriaceae bacterium]